MTSIMDTSLKAWGPVALFFFLVLSAGVDVQLLLVGTKSDLAVHHPQLRKVFIEEVLRFANAHNIRDTIETSAKENTNVEACFNMMAKSLMNSRTGTRSSLNGNNVSTEVGATKRVEQSRCPC